MSGQPVLDIFDPAPMSMVPRCARCGAEGEPILVEGDRWNAAALWCLIAIAGHGREMHLVVSVVGDGDVPASGEGDAEDVTGLVLPDEVHLLGPVELEPGSVGFLLGEEQDVVLEGERGHAVTVSGRVVEGQVRS